MARSPSGLPNSGDPAYSTGASAVVFTTFVAVGAAYIVLAKLATVGQIYVTFVPIVVMVAYALLVWFARNLRLRDDQAGDNLYYMGFLFTLTSLGVSLYQFSASRAAEEIVQNFGIAIGSTITGIALRVIFNQMRHDPIEVERMMRLELAEAARRVRRELDATVVEFGYVRRGAQQAAADSFQLVAEKFDEVAARLLASLADVAAKSAQPLEAASRRSAEMVEQVTRTMAAALSASTQQLGTETGKLSKSAGEIAGALDEMTTKLTSMRTPEGVVEVRLDPVIQSLTLAIERFSAQAEGQGAAVRDVMAAAKTAAQASSDSIIALRQEIAANSATNGATLEKTTGIVIAMAQILEEFETDAKAQNAALRQLIERTEVAIRGLAQVVNTSVNTSLSTSLDASVTGVAGPNGGAVDPLVPPTGAVDGARPSHTDEAGARRPAPQLEAIK